MTDSHQYETYTWQMKLLYLSSVLNRQGTNACRCQIHQSDVNSHTSAHSDICAFDICVRYVCKLQRKGNFVSWSALFWGCDALRKVSRLSHNDRIHCTLFFSRSRNWYTAEIYRGIKVWSDFQFAVVWRLHIGFSGTF